MSDYGEEQRERARFRFMHRIGAAVRAGELDASKYADGAALPKSGTPGEVIVFLKALAELRMHFHIAQETGNTELLILGAELEAKRLLANIRKAR